METRLRNRITVFIHTCYKHILPQKNRFILASTIIGTLLAWNISVFAQQLFVEYNPDAVNTNVLRVLAADTASTSTYTLMVYTNLTEALYTDVNVKLGGAIQLSFEDLIQSNRDSQLYFRTRRSSHEDFDGDGIVNIDEPSYGTQMNQADSDSDGINDGQEVLTYLTDPLDDDHDNDGKEDGNDIYPEALFSDPLNAQSGSVNPIIHTSTPVFSAIYNHPRGRSAVGYVLEVSQTPDFSVLNWCIPSNGAYAPLSLLDGERCPDISSAATQDVEGVHYWRIRFIDDESYEMPFSPAGQDFYIYSIPQPQLEMSAEDINVYPIQPNTGETFSITACIRNTGLADANNIGVSFDADGVPLGAGLSIPSLAAGTETNVTIEASLTDAGFRYLEITAAIPAAPGGDATASRAMFIGPTGATVHLTFSINMDTAIQRNSSPSPTVSGQAQYEVILDSATNTYPVKGGITQYEITGITLQKSRTDANGNYVMGLPNNLPDGGYVLSLSITDCSITGTDSRYFFVSGEIPPETNTPRPDLSVYACDIDLLDWPGAGTPLTNTRVEVVINNQGADSPPTTVSLYDHGQHIDSVTVSNLPQGGQTSVLLDYTVPSPYPETHRLLTVKVEPTANEINTANNEANKRIYVGTDQFPDYSAYMNVLGCSVTDIAITPASTNIVTAVNVRAHHNVYVNGIHYTNIPVCGALVTATITNNDATGSGYTDKNGHSSFYIYSDLLPTGKYEVLVQLTDCWPYNERYRIDDASLYTDFEISWRTNSSELSIDVRNVRFEGEIDANPQVETGSVFQVSFAPWYSVASSQDVPVRLYDRYMQAGSLVSQTLYNAIRTYTGSGSDYIGITYTGNVPGVHIFEVDLAPSFGNPANDKATRTLLVGNTEPTLLVDVLAPANGEWVADFPYTTQVSVKDVLSENVAPTNLSCLIFEFHQDPDYIETVMIVSNGLLAAGSYNDGIYSYDWAPYAAPFGQTKVTAYATDNADGAGSDSSLVIVGKAPDNLLVSCDPDCPPWHGGYEDKALIPTDSITNAGYAPAGIPYFSAVVHEPTDYGVYGYELQVSEEPGFSYLLWRDPSDTEQQFVPTCGVADDKRFWSIPYEGPPLALSDNDLQNVHYYYWRIRFFDHQTNATPWSNQHPWGDSNGGQQFYLLQGSLPPIPGECPDYHTTSINPGTCDFDEDGLTDEEEVILRTNPTIADTDGDGRIDGDEYVEGTDPLDPDDFNTYLYGNILYSGRQSGLIRVFASYTDTPYSGEFTDVLGIPATFTLGLLRTQSNYYLSAYCDTDSDGILDTEEARGTYPANPVLAVGPTTGLDIVLTDPDNDTDTLPDWWEQVHFSNLDQTATNDPDEDGLDNYGEYSQDSDPNESDTDNDTFDDDIEYAVGSDPNDPASFPTSISGDVVYTGSQTGMIRIVARSASCFGPTIYSTEITEPGEYTLTNAVTLSNYWICAYRDSNGDESQDDCEASGQWTNNPIYLTTNITDINITLTEDLESPILFGVPENDIVTACDSMPDAPLVTATDSWFGPVSVDYTEVFTGGCESVVVRTWSASDPCGNTTSATQLIQLEADLTAPLLVIPADRVIECGESLLPQNLGMATVTDACCPDIQTTYQDAFTTNSCTEVELMRIWCATDYCENASIKTQTITIIDSSSPTLTMPSDVTIGCSESSHPSNTGYAVALDMCSTNVLLTYTDIVSDVTCPYTIWRTWSAEDPCGHATSAVQTISVSTNWPFGGGDGTVVDPYQIYTLEQLNNIRGEYLDDHFQLVADIDASPTTNWPNGGFLPIGQETNMFQGVFDGLGHTIDGLYIVRNSETYVGLFGSVSDAEIRNLGLGNACVEASSHVGILAGRVQGASRIANVYSDGSVTSSVVAAGLVGVLGAGSNMTDCRSMARVIAWNWGAAGGLVYESNGTISNCYAGGYVRAKNLVGGLVGDQLGSGLLTDSYASGTVSSWGSILGGLLGNNHGTVMRCYSSGSVSGNATVGGLAGNNYGTGSIGNSFAVGNVSGNSGVGALVGNQVGSLVNCYWNDHSGNPSTCYPGGGSGCTSVNDDESYFYNPANTPLDLWDFSSIWSIPSGGGLPVLQ